MATFTVTQTTDNGLGNTAGTLSYAIVQANQLAGDDAIVFNNHVRLTGATVIPSFIDSNITLQGNGFSLSGDANNNGINDLGDTRPLFIKSGSVSISNLTINNGRAQGEDGSGGGGAGMGGGLFIYDGAVSLNNVVFSNNYAGGGNGSWSGGGGMGIPGIPANNGADGIQGADGADYSHWFNTPGGDGEDGGRGGNGGLGGNGGRGGNGGLGGDGGWGNDGEVLYPGWGGYGGAGGDGGWGGYGGDGGDGGDGGYDPFWYPSSQHGGKGGNGGFGGAGGAGGLGRDGGDGGFGGAGGSGGLGVGWDFDGGNGGDGGYGGGGGNATWAYGMESRGGFGGGDGGSYHYGGGGAGMGGGLFIRSGSLSLNNATFTNNNAVGGTGYEDGKGLGGGLFIMQSLTNSNGNNQGMPTVLPTVTANGLVMFSGNSAADDSGTVTDNDDIWGTITTLSNAIMGTEGDDVLVGTSADDLMIGLGGNDRLDGKGGADEMRGSLGNDTYTVNDPGDLAVENLDEGADTVKSFISYVLPDNVEHFTLLGTANLDGTGNSLANKLTGNNGDNSLLGGEGNDTLDGKGGNDLLLGGLGDDTYLHRHPGSIIVENANEGMDTVKAYFSYSLGANLENLTLMGADDLNGIGNSLNNKLTGNSADNLLNGGAGADILTGKGGADTFIFNFNQSLVNAPDWVKDFTLGEDKIDLLTQGGGNLSAPVSFARAADNKAPTATLTEVMTQVFTDANGALEGNQALGINSAALVKVTTEEIRGIYLVVNNGNSLFQADKDLLINITGLKGGLPNFGAIAVDSFFV